MFEITKTIYSNWQKTEQFLKQNAYLTYFWNFIRSNIIEQLQFKNNNWDLETGRKIERKTLLSKCIQLNLQCNIHIFQPPNAIIRFQLKLSK